MNIRYWLALTALLVMCSLSAAEPIVVKEVYNDAIATYDSEGIHAGNVVSELVLGAIVQNGGITNALGLFEVALHNGDFVWIQPSHVTTSFVAKECKSVKSPISVMNKDVPVSRSVVGECGS